MEGELLDIRLPEKDRRKASRMLEGALYLDAGGYPWSHGFETTTRFLDAVTSEMEVTHAPVY